MRTLDAEDLKPEDKLLLQDLSTSLHQLSQFGQSRFSKLPHSIIGGLLTPYIKGGLFNLKESTEKKGLLASYDSALLDRIVDKTPLRAKYPMRTPEINEKFIQDVIQNGIKIEYLDLSWSGSAVSKPQLEEIISACPNLKALNLKFVEIDFPFLFSLLEKTPNLKKLVVGDTIENLSEANLYISPQSLNNFSQLIELSIYSTKIPDNLTRLIGDNPNLKILEISDCEFNIDVFCQKPTFVNALTLSTSSSSPAISLVSLFNSENFNYVSQLTIIMSETPFEELLNFLKSVEKMPMLQTLEFYPYSDFNDEQKNTIKEAAHLRNIALQERGVEAGFKIIV